MPGIARPGHYIVGAGDTLTSIAKSYGVSESELRGCNPDYGGTLHAGQVLVAPTGGTAPQRLYAEKAARLTAIDITKIPGVMWKLKWTKGARLMTKWFSRPALANTQGVKWKTSLANCDTTTIKLWWVLTYPHPNNLYDQIVRDRIWQNAAARKELVRLLRQTGKVGKPGTIRFGDFTRPVPEIDMRQYVVNSRPFSHNAAMIGIDGLTDLTAALASFNFKVAVAGSITGNTVTITQAGIYVKDSYDFYDAPGAASQELGVWNVGNNTVGARVCLGGTPVANEHFRQWRQLHNRGGDFLVYTDMKIINLPTPVTFAIGSVPGAQT